MSIIGVIGTSTFSSSFPPTLRTFMTTFFESWVSGSGVRLWENADGQEVDIWRGPSAHGTQLLPTSSLARKANLSKLFA